jgi:protein TonB
MNRITPLALLVLVGFMPGAALSDNVQAPAAQSKPKPRAVAPRSPAPEAANGHTTIAPFPVPFDTSRSAAERMKRLNVPRVGETTIAPVPPPAGVEGGVYFGPAPPGAAIVEPLPGVTPRPNPGEPKRLRSEAPVYPDAARKAGVQGTVWLRIHVLENGSVGEAVVIRSIPLLDDAALKAVKQWKYFPPMSQGRPTETWVTVPVKFTLH